MSKQYLILIEQLVREGLSEREIDTIVSDVVTEDDRIEAEAPDEAGADRFRAAA